MYVIYSQDAILKIFLLFPWWQEVSNNEWCRHKVLQYFWTKKLYSTEWLINFLLKIIIKASDLIFL